MEENQAADLKPNDEQSRALKNNVNNDIFRNLKQRKRTKSTTSSNLEQLNMKNHQHPFWYDEHNSMSKEKRNIRKMDIYSTESSINDDKEEQSVIPKVGEREK